MEYINKILCGDSIQILKQIPDESIDCCVSSPPYFQLRDYGIDGQYGLEDSVEHYIDTLCNVFEEVKRVLAPHGTCWVNLGDTYGGANSRASQNGRAGFGNPREGIFKRGKDKSLMLVPYRFAIQMTDMGWYLRNQIIWSKPNAMPSSVKDRFTVDFEPIFFFTKNKKYYFEQQTEPFKSEPPKKRLRNKNIEGSNEGYFTNRFSPGARDYYAKGVRNKRCVWSVPLSPSREQHWAPYPEKLIEIPILAGCPEFVCEVCKTPRTKQYKVTKLFRERPNATTQPTDDRSPSPNDYAGSEREFIGYSECECKQYRKGIVLDPFMGSGTSALVAKRLSRDFVGIDLNPEYCEIANRRLQEKEEPQETLFKL